MQCEGKLVVSAKSKLDTKELLTFDIYPIYLIYGKVDALKEFLDKNKENIEKYYVEYLYKNSLFNLYDLSQTNARVEPGAIIRCGSTISDSAIILMGAIVNTKAIIGDKTMIDMNSVIGSGAIIGKNCHIGAGSVIAGIMEPISEERVIIEDDVFIGANAVILEGVHIGKGAIIGAGSVVTVDVDEYTTVVGAPAKVVGKNKTWKINEGLR
jgi:2,3,4,5-tetrahydropyridine-2,6-dicarboxylate N-acetyltransferase